MGEKLTLTVVAEAHLGLAEANGVLAGADAIKGLELRLLDILQSRAEETPGQREGTRAMSASRCRNRRGTGKKQTDLAGKVDLNGLDANVLRSRGHSEYTDRQDCLGRKELVLFGRSWRARVSVESLLLKPFHRRLRERRGDFPRHCRIAGASGPPSHCCMSTQTLRT